MIEVTTNDARVLRELAQRKTVVEVRPEEVKRYLPEGFLIDDSILEMICSSLNAGSHLMLSGSPGTGKTTLAVAVAKAATNRDAVFTTATSDWTTFDTVGGYLPDLNSPNRLVFEPGILYQSIAERRWVIVDEINRAPIDKAIGPLFSTLSDNDVTLVYKNSTGERLRIVAGNQPNSDNTIYKVDYWRMIATLNEFDKMSLYEMSYAFLRRFALVHIPVPRNYEELVSTWFGQSNSEVQKAVFSIVRGVLDAEIREIGPAVFESMSMYMLDRRQNAENELDHLVEAMELYMLPQFQGVDEDEWTRLLNLTVSQLSDRSEVERRLSIAFSRISGHGITL
jgi:MoxR-like ATPase